MPASSSRVYAPSRRFSSTVIRANSRLPSGLCATPRRRISWAGIRCIGSPSSSTSPDTGRKSPEIVRRVVVLPAPLLPIRLTIWPCSTVNVTPRTAWIAP